MGQTGHGQKEKRRLTAWLLIGALAFGITARLIWPADMEWKSDEKTIFNWTQEVVHNGRWEPIGMPSGVHLRNPGLSVWVFALPAKLFGITTPTQLVTIVGGLGALALGLFAWFARTRLSGADRETWYWALALFAVNPIAINYHRKIWTISILPIFCFLFIWAWFSRRKPAGAFFWGLVGALLGQIHMSGFPFALGVVLWTALVDRRSVVWKFWFLGSVVGTLPMLNWIYYVIEQASVTHVRGGGWWIEVLQLRFWVYWLTNPFGLHLGKVLGIHNGNGTWDQLADFFRYPFVMGRATWLSLILHVGLLSGLLLSLGALILATYRAARERRFFQSLLGRTSDTTLLESAVVWGFGSILTLMGILIYRFYLVITMPLSFLWVARVSPRRLLVVLLLIQMGVSAIYLHYIHENSGSPRGDYGPAYHLHPSSELPMPPSLDFLGRPIHR